MECTRSRQVAMSVSTGATTPKRNGLVMSGIVLSGRGARGRAHHLDRLRRPAGLIGSSVGSASTAPWREGRPSPMSSAPQVRLVPATVPMLTALTDEPALFADLVGSPAPDGWPEFPEAIPFTLAYLQGAPEADRGWSMQFFLDGANGQL